MSLFRRKEKKAATVEASKHDGAVSDAVDFDAHFSVAGKPTTTFEIVGEERAPPAPADPHAAWRPPSHMAAPPRLAPLPPPVYTTPITPRPVRDPRPEPPAVPTEWARRGVGPAPPGKVKGMCSGCGSVLFVSCEPRPMRVACPVCGRQRVLS